MGIPRPQNPVGHVRWQPHHPLRTLEKAEFIGGEKLTGDGRPQTLYNLTPTGRRAFIAYLGILEKILDLGK